MDRCTFDIKNENDRIKSIIRFHTCFYYIHFMFSFEGVLNFTTTEITVFIGILSYLLNPQRKFHSVLVVFSKIVSQSNLSTTCRTRHKVNCLAEYNWCEYKIFLLLDVLLHHGERTQLYYLHIAKRKRLLK